MKTRPTTPLTEAQRNALEARFALRVSARLNEGVNALPHDVTERLRVARQQAMRVARESRLELATAGQTATAGAVTVAGVSSQGTVVLGGWNDPGQSRAPGHGRRLDDGPMSWGWRLASALPVLALVAGLWGVHQYYQQEKVQAAADIDMAILTDELPPDAYSDPGFEEYLRTDNGPAVRPIDSTLPEPDGDLRTTETTPAASTTENAPAPAAP